MDAVHVHQCIPGKNKRARIGPPPISKPRRKRQSHQPDDKGQISFSSVRATRTDRRGGTGHQKKFNPPPLPMLNSEFLLHTPPSSPCTHRIRDSPVKKPPTPSFQAHFLGEPDSDSPVQSVSDIHF
jgi:hypothetical protein